MYLLFIFISQKPTLTANKLDEYIAKDEARNKWNGLQEWFWVKQDMKYYTLNLPIDLDALTFRISRYGTQNIDIRWTLGTNCHKNNTISYKNETQIILNYIWTNIIGNKSKSYICHRNFDKDINDLEILWWLTTVWVGYDFDCFKINSLKEGIVESVLISKNDMTKMLAIVICFVGFMHPFIWYIFESVQLRKKHEIFCYYEDVIDSEKPYGLVRGLRKFLYPSERKIYNGNISDRQENITTVNKRDNDNNEPGGQSSSINADNPANAIEVDIENNTSPKQPVNTEELQDAPTNELSDEIEIDPTFVFLTGQSGSVPTIAILDVIEYVPIFRFSVVITLIICSMHLYKLTDVDKEMFKEKGYFNFLRFIV
ncbi:unnamed protein product [Mytilus edulis]|uniref:Uncharacterized protein n=1 Tax=Mytilus edulis TaxID=6550 RepID=A0A8S3QVL0_MYTED|nr:unnamed protein product [Mytilus edulis]